MSARLLRSAARATALSAVLSGVTALSVLASPLTESKAWAESDPATDGDKTADPPVHHHHHHDDSSAKEKDKDKDRDRASAAAATPSAPSDAPAATVAPAAVVPAPAATTPTIAPTAAAAAPMALATPPAPAGGTPLGVVPSKPLELSSDAPSMNIGWKIGAMGLLAGLGLWAWSKSKKGKTIELPVPELKILRRTSIGVRSELLLVDLEGQRLLLGVTPNSIQSLLIVPDSSMSDPIPVEEPVAAPLRTMPTMSMMVGGQRAERGERGGRSERASQIPPDRGSRPSQLPERGPRASQIDPGERSSRSSQLDFGERSARSGSQVDRGELSGRSPSQIDRGEREARGSLRTTTLSGAPPSRRASSTALPAQSAHMATASARRRRDEDDVDEPPQSIAPGQAEGLLAFRRGR